MTETALNERIAELQENESEAAHQRQKARRRLRRGTNIRKTDDLLRIINYGGYAPHRGYINWGFSGRTLPIQANTSNIPRTATARGGSREKQAAGFADAGMFLQKATITVGSSIIGGHCIDKVNLNG